MLPGAGGRGRDKRYFPTVPQESKVDALQVSLEKKQGVGVKKDAEVTIAYAEEDLSTLKNGDRSPTEPGQSPDASDCPTNQTSSPGNFRNAF